MANTATVYNPPSSNIYIVRVNGKDIVSDTDQSRMVTIQTRLNAIFSDSNRDLDFITPSYYNNQYVVICPLVRKNVGFTTYFYDTNGSNGWDSYPAKLYEDTIWNNTNNANQTAIYTASGLSPWYDALTVANRLRDAVVPNYSTAAGNSTISKFVEPSNKSWNTSSTISSSAYYAHYGDPCQGTQPGTTSTCGSKVVQNIWSAQTANGEVFHPCDLTAAMTSTGSWSTTYRNKYVKVTNLANSQSIVVRVTDVAPANTGIELSWRAHNAIGAPGSGANKVKIELMATL